jgi:hypothetical protein
VPAIGFGVVWFGYALTSWGYILVRGYPIRFTDWINPLHPYAGAWPPAARIPAGEVFPGVTVGSAGSAAEGADPAPVLAVLPGSGTVLA